MTVPPLNGLVLAGGRSTRMGADKGALVYAESGLDQRRHCAELLAIHCREIFVSCRAAQLPALAPSLRPITDAADLVDLGPAAGLLSAHRHTPGAAWLVLAVDFPFASPRGLANLVEAREPQGRGTAYENDEGILEPLFAIWEPAGLAALAASARDSPRRVLEAGPCRRVRASERRLLLNVNAPGEFP
jgi:molybdopterin-guanine dinucleotide biosynthesis protein A